jgi:hypothetical protein
MEFNIPLSYCLKINDLFINDYDYNYYHSYKYHFENNNKVISFINFNLYINKQNLIYKIKSNISLNCLLDFLHNYNNLILKKIYYFLIVKYLISKHSKIKKESIYHNPYLCYSYDYYNLILRTRDYHISNNNEIIVTDFIDYNICLIIMNATINKSFITIIDTNCLLENLDEIILNSNLFINSRFEDIHIIIIGGSIENVDIIIKIYQILKELKIVKYICKTYLFRKKPIKRLLFDSSLMTIRKMRYYSHIYLEAEKDNSDHIKNKNFFSKLHRI